MDATTFAPPCDNKELTYLRVRLAPSRFPTDIILPHTHLKFSSRNGIPVGRANVVLVYRNLIIAHSRLLEKNPVIRCYIGLSACQWRRTTFFASFIVRHMMCLAIRDFIAPFIGPALGPLLKIALVLCMNDS